jgi:hypothetical protein
MIRIVPFSPEHAAGVMSVILPIQQIEFEIPITLEAQPDLKDIRGFYQRSSHRENSGRASAVNMWIT